MMRSAVIGLAATLLMVMLVVAVATSALTILPGDASAPVPTAWALERIPRIYLALYQQAAQGCPGLPWTVLAAIGEVESDHGRSTAPGVRSGANSAGAAGPMQMGIGTGPAGDAFWRFALDGNADGTASPYDPADAIPTAAAYLCQALADHSGDLAGAVFAYNHNDAYVDHVLALAASYGAAVEASTQAADQAVAFSLAQLGTPYRWGGDGLGKAGSTAQGWSTPPTRLRASRCRAPPRPSTTPARTFAPSPHWSPATWCSSAPARPTSATSGSWSARAGWSTRRTPGRWYASSPTRGGPTWAPLDQAHLPRSHRRSPTQEVSSACP